MPLFSSRITLLASVCSTLCSSERETGAIPPDSRLAPWCDPALAIARAITNQDHELDRWLHMESGDPDPDWHHEDNLRALVHEHKLVELAHEYMLIT